MNINKRILILIVAAALIGGFFGSLAAAGSAQANLFKNFYEQYLKPLAPQISPNDNQQPTTGNQQPTTDNRQQIQSSPYLPTIDYEQAIIKAVEEVSPAVVSVIVSKDLPVVEQCPYNPFSDLPKEFQQFFGQGFEFYQPCPKGVKRQEIGGGSGFVISSDGLIVTNKHVVSDAKASYTVLTNDGRKYEAQILARDPSRDFAVLKISADNLPVVRLGNSDTVKLGQTAIAIGNALGEFRNTVSVGVVSGLARTITAAGSGLVERFEGLIQTDAAINQGNSGGPLLNLKGEVVGINAAMVSGAQNIGFAIPINQVKPAIDSVRKTGRIITPYLGVRYLAITSELAKKEKLSVDYGALIRGSEDGSGVMPNSPAAKAGLQAEDIILELNGVKINQENFLASLIQKYNVGDEITLKILRNGKEMEIKAKLEERPRD
jgi:serine protease Do